LGPKDKLVNKQTTTTTVTKLEKNITATEPTAKRTAKMFQGEIRTTTTSLLLLSLPLLLLLRHGNNNNNNIRLAVSQFVA